MITTTTNTIEGRQEGKFNANINLKLQITHYLETVFRA